MFLCGKWVLGLCAGWFGRFDDNSEDVFLAIWIENCHLWGFRTGSEGLRLWSPSVYVE